MKTIQNYISCLNINNEFWTKARALNLLNIVSNVSKHSFEHKNFHLLVMISSNLFIADARQLSDHVLHNISFYLFILLEG